MHLTVIKAVAQPMSMAEYVCMAKHVHMAKHTLAEYVVMPTHMKRHFDKWACNANAKFIGYVFEKSCSRRYVCI